ncbi:MAG TPA: dTDP-4-dehydrorhamnose 3,5-epimerase [Gemmatimonadales bacterium]|nr:dTDP-4-dehydrorhamnose 3,5-epimerase [Gemmatimonadales bacterium]
MIVTPTALPEVLLVRPDVHADQRGFFLEVWRADRYGAAGIPGPFVQDNHSRSAQHTLRGLHYQVGRPQGKLVRVASGSVYDVAVDLRRSSRSFGRWVGTVLDEQNHNQLWIPPGFAHGFYVLSEHADVIYKCTEPYVAGGDRAVRWDDPDLGIDWPLAGAGPPTLSPKDAAAPSLAQAEAYP